MTDAPRLAVVGASARAAAFSALRAGFRVVTADLFADADLASACPATRISPDHYPESLADWLAAQDVDAWMYTGALENHPDLVDRMAAIKPLWGNRGDALRRARNPIELWRVARENGLRFPDTTPNPKGLPLDGSWLCKTYRGSNGAGVWALNNQADWTRAMAATAVFQQRLPGPPHAAVYVIGQEGHRLLGVTRQLVGEDWLNAPAWAYCGSIRQAVEPSSAIADQLDRVGDLLRNTLRLRGLVGVDCLINRQPDGDTVTLLEINPRYTASMELCGTAVAEHACCFDKCREREMSHAEAPLPAGKAILYAKREATAAQPFYDWAITKAEAGRLADIPSAGTQIQRGSPVLTLLEGSLTEGVPDRLKIRAAEVESRLYR